MLTHANAIRIPLCCPACVRCNFRCNCVKKTANHLSLALFFGFASGLALLLRGGGGLEALGRQWPKNETAGVTPRPPRG